MNELKPHEIDRLVRAAIDARDQAYAPHSHFYVGAALLLPDDQIICGCNVENASYSLSICAERGAAVTAVAQGYLKYRAVAVATVGGVTPCGACRQFLAEFGLDLQVIMVNVLDGARRSMTLSRLLPEAFEGSDLPSNV